MNNKQTVAEIQQPDIIKIGDMEFPLSWFNTGAGVAITILIVLVVLNKLGININIFRRK